MKKLFSVIILLFVYASVFSQSPPKLLFKTTIKDKTGAKVTNTPLNVKITVIKGSAIGDVQFSEIHSVTTDAQGLVNVEIGKGTLLNGTLDGVNWETEEFLIKTEVESLGISKLSKIKRSPVTRTESIHVNKTEDAAKNAIQPAKAIESPKQNNATAPKMPVVPVIPDSTYTPPPAIVEKKPLPTPTPQLPVVLKTDSVKAPIAEPIKTEVVTTPIEKTITETPKPPVVVSKTDSVKAPVPEPIKKEVAATPTEKAVITSSLNITAKVNADTMKAAIAELKKETAPLKPDTITAKVADIKKVKKSRKDKNAPIPAVIVAPIDPASLKKIPFQTVITNINGVPFSAAPVIIKLNVLKDSASGPSVLEEMHTTITNDEGEVNLIIGNGVPIKGNIGSLDWATQIYFIKTETNPTGVVKINKPIVPTTALSKTDTTAKPVVVAINKVNSPKKPQITQPVQPVIKKVDTLASKNITPAVVKIDSVKQLQVALQKTENSLPKKDTVETIKPVQPIVAAPSPKTAVTKVSPPTIVIDTIKEVVPKSILNTSNTAPKFSDAYKEASLSSRSDNSWESIKKQLKAQNEAILENPDNVNAYRERGILKNQLQDYRGAITDFSKVLEMDPKNAEIYNARGNAKTQLKNYKGAMEDFEKAIKLNPRYANAYASRGIAQANMEDFSSALNDLDTAISITPDSAIFYSYRGTCKNNLSDYKGALEDYDKALKINPKDPLTYYNRGNTNVQMKDPFKAIEDFNKSIALNPNYASVYYKRANAKADLQDARGALIDYDKAIQLDPENIKAYFNAGVMKNKLKDYEGAIVYFSKAIELEPTWSNAYYSRGVAKLALGQIDNGCNDLSKAGELGYTQAYEAIRKNCN